MASLYIPYAEKLMVYVITLHGIVYPLAFIYIIPLVCICLTISQETTSSLRFLFSDPD
jgi:hypothetical protein